MSPVSISLPTPPPTDPLSHLQHARQALVNELPPKHDLRRRVQPDDHGELLPEQPAGRPRTLFKVAPARKRGKESGDPTVVLERRLLMIMWNEKYHLKEWDRVRDKMSVHRKRLGMKERPYKDGDSCIRIRRDNSVSSSNKVRERAARRFAQKRQRSDADTSDTGNESSGEEQAKKKRRRPDSGCRERERSQPPSTPRRDQEASQKLDESTISSGDSSEELTGKKRQGYGTLWTRTDWNLSPSPLETPSRIPGASDSSSVASDTVPPPVFPTATEVVEAIPASGLSMRMITGLFWDRVSSDMDEFFFLLHANTNIDLDKGLIRRKEATCGELLLAELVADGAGTNDRDKFCELTLSDEIGGRNVRLEDGSAL